MNVELTEFRDVYTWTFTPTCSQEAAALAHLGLNATRHVELRVWIVAGRKEIWASLTVQLRQQQRTKIR